MRGCLLFLGRFVLVSSAAFCLWEGLSQLYVATVVPAANLLNRCADLPVELQNRGGGVVLYCYRLLDGSVIRLQAHDHDAIYLNSIVVAALFLATPAAWSWRWRWIARLWVFLWITHVASFFMGSSIAIWDFAWTQPAAQRSELIAEFGRAFPLETRQFTLRLLELWNVWARYGIGLAVWYVAVRREADFARVLALRSLVMARTRDQLVRFLSRVPVFSQFL